MPDVRYKTCRLCNRSTVELGEPLSWTRLCSDCADERREANIRQLHAHSGPWFDHWRYGMVAAVLDPSYVGALVAAGILEPQD